MIGLLSLFGVVLDIILLSPCQGFYKYLIEQINMHLSYTR